MVTYRAETTRRSRADPGGGYVQVRRDGRISRNECCRVTQPEFSTYDAVNERKSRTEWNNGVSTRIRPRIDHSFKRAARWYRPERSGIHWRSPGQRRGRRRVHDGILENKRRTKRKTTVCLSVIGGNVLRPRRPKVKCRTFLCRVTLH